MEFLDSTVVVILLGTGTSLLMQLAKKIKIQPHLLLFGIALIVAVGYSLTAHFAGDELLKTIGVKVTQIFTMAIAVYEVLLSRMFNGKI